MKLYAVYFDNGESYEDHYYGLNRLFLKKEDAVKYIEDEEGYVKGDENAFQKNFFGPEYWERENIEHYVDSTGNECVYNWGTEYLYIKEVEAL